MQVNETRDPPRSFVPKQVLRRKLYELIDWRNEWTDWHGSTDVTARTSNWSAITDVDNSHVMQKRAETRRKPGTSFSLFVLPVLVFEDSHHCLMIGQRRSSTPLAGLMQEIERQNIKSIAWEQLFAEVFRFTLARQGGFILIPKDRSLVGGLEEFSDQNPAFSFSSVAYPPPKSMGWKSTSRADTRELDAFVQAIERKRIAEARAEAISVGAAVSGSRPTV